ncbi:DUF4263 domain-containing protein [Methylocapsa sp. D3K7]|uniref:Shedu immune nuclease family protein n=1 Tax=Methylocapsa sp. D3K7 TaxID=3041435 RepID=UPI00244EC47D|nr:DUF4263 domain-containing protein [Methylocapsa sp. D3K7]WGJ15774.1 DUF4263 domain-containing protein [Methylocapsa sp. D3K7]
MNDELEDRSFFFTKKPGKTFVSKSFCDQLTGKKLRIASRIVEGQEGLKFAVIENEATLRVTPMGRYEIKAVVLEDDRAIKTLTIQKYSSSRGPLDREHFSFVGSEIDTLLKFILAIKTAPLADDRKLHLSDEELGGIVLDQGQARRIFSEHEDLFLRIAQNEELKRDLVAVGYRRKQLERFEALLRDRTFFEAEKRRLATTPEGLWQKFFESNTWIFGYGLSYQFLTSLDDRKLEQVVRGHDVAGSGKRSDGLMKTRGLIGSLCFVEIKRHDTPLLDPKPYRPAAWAPSPELCGGVAQVQATVQEAVQNIGRKLAPMNDYGDPTGEILFNIEPRSFLVIGSLDQFVATQGINEQKFRSFETFRRNTRRPEVLTFDEVLHRAQFIIEHSE